MRWLFLALLTANLVPGFLPGNSASPITVSPQVVNLSSAKGIVLLSEADPEVHQLAQIDNGGSQSLSEAAGGGCIVVGPLASVALADRLQEALEGEGVAAKRMIREVDSGSDYWVHLQLQPSARATARLLEELKANGRESFVVSEGDLEGAIALGIYSDEEEAKANLSVLTASGYEAGIYRMQRRAREYWLLADGKPENELLSAIPDFYQSEEVPQKISRSSCKTVASAMRFQ